MRRIPVKFAVEKSFAMSALTSHPIVGNVKAYAGEIPDYLLEVVPDKMGGLVILDPAGPTGGPGTRKAKEAAAKAAEAEAEA